MEGNEVHATGNGRVHYGFVGGGIPSTGRRVHAPDLGNEVRPEPWQRGDEATSDAICGGRGKEVRTLAGAFEPISTMTEARAHATRASPAVALNIRCSGSAAEESPPAATAAGRERREVPCGHFGAPPGRSCGSPDLWSGATRFECWWPLARGNPASIGSSRGPSDP
jgi:hypothetical protein